MFRPTSPQTSLLEPQFLLPAKKRERLRRSWAEAFRTKILPLIEEEAFRDCFSEDNGRPNKSIRLLVGMHILKAADDLTDEQILDALEFNLQWQHALGVEPADAHVCEKTLHNFRHLLMKNARAQAVFTQITAAVAKADGLSGARQRMDSTHVISNIAVLTRLGLFTETVSAFLRELREKAPEKLAKVVRFEGTVSKRYLDREGYFADATREQAPRRLPVVAQDVCLLVRLFEDDTAVTTLASYMLLARLLSEQCTVTEPPAGSTTPPSVVIREPKEIGGNSLQSPHDADATYGHKGKGYEAQIAETCVPENPYQLITGVRITDACGSDQKATVPMVEQLVADGHKPDVMFGDTGYGSGENIVECAELGVELFARVQDGDAPARPDPFLSIATPQAAAAEAPRAPDAPDAPAQQAVAVEAPRAPDAPDAPAQQAVAVEAPDAPTTEPAGEVSDVPHTARPTIAIALGNFTFSATFDEVVACPAGAMPIGRRITDTAFHATFPGTACAVCPFAGTCPARAIAGTEDRVLRFRDSVAATATRQREQQDPAFREAYKVRSGIESTNAELKGRHGAADLRVRGRPRVEVAIFLKALSLNVKRAIQYHTEALRHALTDVESSGLAIA